MGVLDAPVSAQSIARLAVSGIGNRFVFLGDSVTQGGDDVTTPYLHLESWPTYAALLSGGRILKLQNAGVHGDTAAMALARFDTDVTPYAPNVVTLCFGPNEAGNSLSLDAFKTNMTALVAKCQAIRAAPVLCTACPNGTPTVYTRIRLYNLWLRRYAAANGFPLVDFNRLLQEPTGASYISGYSGDNIHPNVVPRFLMAAEFVTVLSAYLRPFTPPLGYSYGEDYNLLNGGTFAADSNADGVADSWTSTGTSGGAVRSTVSPTAGDGATGKWQRVACTDAGAGEFGVQQTISTGWSVGDTLVFTGRIRTAGITSTANARLYLVCTGAAHNIELKTITQAVPSGVFYIEAVVPAATTAINCKLVVASPSGSSTITVDVANVAVRNLTTLALGV